jgi:TonB-dependent starch-binding outer membrane protein SusC
MKKTILLFCLIACIVQAYAQRTITGTVTSKSDGQPLPGASVMVKGTSTGGITDIDGKFMLKIQNDAKILVFSFVGYLPQDIEVGTQDVYNVVMEEDMKNIDEIVVVGYGTQKKSLVTGAIAKVDGAEIAKGANLRVTQAIQGKTAGVNISNNSGQPGDFVSVNVRGTGTNGNSQPLYIVDGLPTNGYGIDYLNSSDIASIEVLKDAASAAIYGARGANGVVLITTKTGKKGQKFEISYDGYYGAQNAAKKLTTLNKSQYLEMMRESYANASKEFPWSQTQVDKFADTDWQEEMFVDNAVKTNHVISFTGGGDNSTYASSISYFKQDGIVGKGKSSFERYTWRLNTDREFGILKVGMNFNIANLKSKGIDANDRYGISLAQAVNMPPIVPVYLADGSFATPENYIGMGLQEITNPVALMSILNNETVTNKVNSNLWGEIDFGKVHPVLAGLKFRTQYATELAFVNYRSYTPVYYFASTKYNNINSTDANFHKYVSWNFDNFLTYDKTVALHHFNVMLGISAYKAWDNDVSGGKKQLTFNDFEHAYLNNATDNTTAVTGGGFGEHTMASYVGRLNYDYNSRYMLTATFRADGSSRFGSNNKFGYFPSVSAGWVISNESFMPLSDVISLAKFRASWGQNGNEEIGNFRYTSVMSYGSKVYFGQDKTEYAGMQPSALSNPDLRWEASEQTDIALDLGFFKNKLTLTADYYIKKTKDWLITAPIPLTAGNSPAVINGGEIKNTGIELELGYKTKVGDVNFDLNLTGAYNKGEVIDLPNAEKRLTGGDGGFGQSAIKKFSIGETPGYFSGVKVAGVFQTQDEVEAYLGGADGKTKIQPNAVAGDFKFIDQNNDGKIDDNDRVNLGQSSPDFIGGFNFNASWKGLDFSMFWYTALGQSNWMAIRRYDQIIANYTSEYYENRWTGPGTSNEYPRVTETDANNNWKTASSFYVKDASYLRLKNLTLGYSLPKSVTNFLKLSKVRFYVSGENLLTFTKYPGYEPEIGGGWDGAGIDRGIYPQARSVIGGINITF